MAEERRGDELNGRQRALREIEACVCKDRAATYGAPERNFSNIAAIASVVLQHQFDAKDVALFLACVKLARMVSSPLHRDNWIDLAGYAVCGAEIAEEIVAKTAPA
jgi:hypothetical protein